MLTGNQKIYQEILQNIEVTGLNRKMGEKVMSYN